MAWCHQEWSHYLSLINFNSLWPSDAIWREGSRSTLVQVMACCLTTSSHYLNQCRLMISEVLWHSPDSNFTENTQDIYHWNEFESYHFETVITSPRGQWVKSSCQGNFAKKWCDKKLLQSQNCLVVYSHLLQICTQNRNIANKAVLPYLSIYSIKLWQKKHRVHGWDCLPTFGFRLSPWPPGRCGNNLTHWGPDKMAPILQTVWNSFSWLKIFEFWLKSHWSLFPRVQLTI